MKSALIALPVALWAATAWSDCASEAEITTFVTDYMAHTPTRALGDGATMAEALCTQDRLVTALAPHLGSVRGYKVGLTSPPAQARFGVREPVRGRVFEAMLAPDGAQFPARFGSVPMVESDLILVVGDAAINAARTPEEVVQTLAEIRPFIELPDLALAAGEPLTGATITAMGVGPRLGVLGAAIPVTDAARMNAQLAEMKVTLTAADGTVLSEAPGRAVLGHPANSVLWLVEQGVALAPGDMISVGSFGPLVPVARTGGAVTAVYDGLPGNPEVSASFD